VRSFLHRIVLILINSVTTANAIIIATKSVIRIDVLCGN